jgi:hypothetical protein
MTYARLRVSGHAPGPAMASEADADRRREL